VKIKHEDGKERDLISLDIGV